MPSGAVGGSEEPVVKAPEPVFSDLDASGRFHRDTTVGRLFHPGTVSFREISPVDSLHITVSPDNRVSVHVDSVSPLDVRPGRRTRYSVVRAVGHNAVHVFEAAVRACTRRRADHRCHLDCEIVVVDEGAQDVYEFSCKAAGAEGCGWSTRATSQEELVANVADHARRKHGVKNFTDTIARYATQVSLADR